MRRRALVSFGATLAAAAVAASCSSAKSEPAPTYLSREALMDPQSCTQCHADHVADWSSSMHAYAADDPVFLAMNKRGQRVTGGALGSFCVNCHAPMAVRTGATTDGLNLADVPRALKGVSCYFCHAVDDVQGAHDNPLHLADDDVMRGPFGDPVANTAHRAGYSKLHDRDQLDSAKLCGACHDIVNGHGTAIERTYQEWQGTVFAHAPGGATCGQCHMDQSAALKPVAQAPGVFARRYHGHAFPGVDVPLTPVDDAAARASAVKKLLDTSLQSSLCVGDGRAGIDVILDNVAAGHAFPSGSAQDRRAWVEVVAYAGGQVVYQSGVVPDGTPVTSITDPDLWLLRDCMFGDGDAQVSMFWDAKSVESHLLPGQITFDATDPRFYQTHIVQSFPRKGMLSAIPDRVTLRVRLQPMGLDVLDDLVESGDLDPSVRAKMPTLDIGEQPLVEWTPAKAQDGYLVDRTRYTCVTNTNLTFKADKVRAAVPVKCR